MENKGRVIYFGHNPNFRIPARPAPSKQVVTPVDLVPVSLRDPLTVDFADALFGYIRDKALVDKKTSRQKKNPGKGARNALTRDG